MQTRGIGEVYLGYFVAHEAEVVTMHRLARKAKVAIIYTTFETTKVTFRGVCDRGVVCGDTMVL